MTKSIKKVVLAYSGGLDTSAMLLWLKETYDCEVICYCADVGQGEELSGLEEKALATGASKLYVEDLREEFVKDFVWMAVKANALYEGVYLLGTSLARPVIAKRQIEIAQMEGADAVAHGATGNDQVRFELTYYSLKPDIKVVAPWRTWEFKGRADLIAYCAEHGIPVTATAAKPYSMDRNLMHISYEGGILEDPWAAPPDDIFLLSKSPEKASDTAQEITLSFEKGEPVAIDGVKYGAVDLLTKLNFLGGEHGIAHDLWRLRNRREAAPLLAELADQNAVRDPEKYGQPDPRGRQRRCPPQTIQGQCHRQRPQIPQFALPRTRRNFRRRRRCLRPTRCGRVY